MAPVIATLLLLAFQAPAALQEGARTEVIAHRGGAGPDGTLAGVSRSLAAGVRFLELDVRLTRDGHAVILHDPTVDRTTDGTGPVAEMTLEQVRKLDAGAKYRDPAEPDRSFAGERIPTVEEMIRFVGARGVVLLELKVAAAADPVVSAVRAEKAFDRVVVRSADKEVLRRLKSLDARVRLGTMGKVPAENLDGFVEELLSLGVESFTAPTIDRAQTERFHAKRIAVWGSNTNDPAVMKSLIAAGVDGIITDQVPVLTALLRPQEAPAPSPPPPTPDDEESRAILVQARAGLWKIPSFQATLPGGSREIQRGTLFDAGADITLFIDPIFVTTSIDYGVSGSMSILSGSAQVGFEADIGELLLPLSFRGSGGVLFGRMEVDEPTFGDFKTGVGFVLRAELTARVTETLSASLWFDYRNIKFDFEPTVVAGDTSAGGSTIAVGLSLGIRF
jgi:glycerophosphoryl diester phosphodiesterase